MAAQTGYDGIVDSVQFTPSPPRPGVKDTHWLRQAFILPKNAIDATDGLRRTYSPGFRKFADTTLGGNAAINPPPQFTKFADIPERRFHDNIGKGMGRYYSEAIDDHSVLVHMRFGVPAFNSLTSFFGNFYSSDASRLARTGRSTDLLYNLGRLAGFVVSISLLPFILIGQTVKFLAQKPSTKYYYLKPAMPAFWNAVNTTLNTYAANVGFITGVRPESYDQAGSGLSPQDVSERNRLLPEIYREDGRIDIYRVATRFQRLADQQYRKILKIREEATSMEDAQQKYGEFLEQPIFDERGRSLNEYIRAYLGLRQAQPQPTESKEIEVADAETPDTKTKTTFLNEPSEDVRNLFGTDGQEDAAFSEFMLAELRDGAQFITLRVDNPGSASESFSNSVKESEIASTINSISSGARSTRFSFADGNLSDGVIGKMVGGVLQGVGSVISGFADAIGVSGLASLAGNAMVDIPKHWDASSANLPRMQYTMELRAPYGNEMSRFQSLIVPLTYLLAGALPLSTGTQSYTSPFLCELYCKGRAQTRLGMIDSLEITRGAGNIGWTSDGKPLGIDVSFTVVDLSSIMHMPITAAFTPLDVLNPLGWSKILASDDSTFGDYMAVLSGLGLVDQVYVFKKLKRNYYRALIDFNQWANPAHFANWVGGLQPARVLSGIYMATSRE